jgi:hypothetical protein
MHVACNPEIQDDTLIGSILSTDAVVKAIMNQTNTTFFGFALADSMFAGDCLIERLQLSATIVAERIAQGVTSCCNPSHEATIRVMHARFGLVVEIPAAPPRVVLHPGDRVIVMGVRGLPRLTDRHEYTDEEIAQATFVFSEYRVLQPSGFTTMNGG